MLSRLLDVRASRGSTLDLGGATPSAVWYCPIETQRGHMDWHLLGRIAAFAFVTAVTPGPNNVIALSSGVTHGFRATMPMIWGVSLGFPAMQFAVALGLGSVLAALPWAYPAIQIVGALYLLWLAWKIAMSADLGIADGPANAKPVTFLQSCLFQWVNPKAWIIAVGGLATYVPVDNFWPSVALFTLTFCVIAWPATALWAGFGVLVQRWLGTTRRVRVFNIAMAALLVVSLVPVLGDLWEVFRARLWR
jgi:threonine/homoserine/homoserine lactone efflux protein